MGQIKNIKLHIVTDIKHKQTKRWPSQYDYTAKESSLVTNVVSAINTRTPHYFALKELDQRKRRSSTLVNVSHMCIESRKHPLRKGTRRQPRSDIIFLRKLLEELLGLCCIHRESKP